MKSILGFFDVIKIVWYEVKNKKNFKDKQNLKNNYSYILRSYNSNLA